MTDPIERQAAIDEIARWIGYIDEDMILRIQTGLKKVPSAQRKGQWIFVNKFRGQHKCSVCGIVAVQARNGFHLESSPTDNTGEHAIIIDHYKEFLSDYCPNCGAKMEERE